MPVQHIQLRERLKQSLAAQPSGGKAPTSALGRRLVQGPSPYAGPSTGRPERKSITSSFPSAPSLPTPTGGAPDYQKKAWDLRKALVGERGVSLDEEANALYQYAQTLDDENAQFVLNKVIEKNQVKTSTISSGGETVQLGKSKDPLLKKLEDNNYVRLNEETGTYSWMLPEEEEKIKEFLTSWESTKNPGKMVIMYKDASVEETDIDMPKPELSPEGEIQTETLRQLKEAYGERFTTQAVEEQEAVPIPGVTLIPMEISTEYPDGVRLATPADVEAYWIRVSDTADRLKRLAEGGAFTVEDVMETYKDDPQAIRNIQIALGITPTGVLGDSTIEALKKTFGPGTDFGKWGGL